MTAVWAEYDARTHMRGPDDALAKVEAAALFDTTSVRRHSNTLLKRALKAWKKGEAPKTAQLALAATEADESNAQAFHLLAIALEKLGHTHKALVTYERAFQLEPDDPDLLLDFGLTAWNLGMLEGAERMFQLYIEKLPDRPEGYNNLGSVQRDRGDLAAALATLQGALYRMPEQPMLWNTLATVLAEEGRVEESLDFYGEALRLDPRLGRAWHNLGYAYSRLGRLAEALEAYDHALTLADHPNDRIEGKHARGVCLMGMGRIDEGFREYESRHAPEFRASVLHLTKAPVWAGEPLNGRRILVVGEQALDDEFMFANILPDIARDLGETGTLQIAVDPRLIALFQRSYPRAQVGDYQDGKLEGRAVRFFPWALKHGEPDFHAPMGTPLHFYRQRLSDFPRQAFLTADPRRVADYRARLKACAPGPHVGLCWRSMTTGMKRKNHYSPIESWAPILSTPGVTFVNLQSGACGPELDLARQKLGVTIHAFPELDLRNDIDGAAALSAACDLVISAPTAAAALAGAIGTEVWFLAAGRVWPQLGTDHYPWYRASRVFAPRKFADWNEAMLTARAALAAKISDPATRTRLASRAG
jgi:tetratricopeptide (TPR) repeat protein